MIALLASQGNMFYSRTCLHCALRLNWCKIENFSLNLWNKALRKYGLSIFKLIEQGVPKWCVIWPGYPDVTKWGSTKWFRNGNCEHLLCIYILNKMKNSKPGKYTYTMKMWKLLLSKWELSKAWESLFK